MRSENFHSWNCVQPALARGVVHSEPEQQEDNSSTNHGDDDDADGIVGGCHRPDDGLMGGNLTANALPFALLAYASPVDALAVELVGIAANVTEALRVTSDRAISSTKSREALAHTLLAQTVCRAIVARVAVPKSGAA